MKKIVFDDGNNKSVTLEIVGHNDIELSIKREATEEISGYLRKERISYRKLKMILRAFYSDIKHEFRKDKTVIELTTIPYDSEVSK